MKVLLWNEAPESLPFWRRGPLGAGLAWVERAWRGVSLLFDAGAFCRLRSIWFEAIFWLDAHVLVRLQDDRMPAIAIGKELDEPCETSIQVRSRI